MHALRVFWLICAGFSATGCAHPLVISPDLARIERPSDLTVIDKSVAYFIAPELLGRQVTTPGGGGDSVSYHPYRDLEAALYKMLGNVFRSVNRLKAAADRETINNNSVSYVMTPEITTTSLSSSIFTWPPTSFSVALTLDVADAAGKSMSRISSRGDGQAEFDEFKSDFSLSGKRAALDAVLKMQKQLLESAQLRKP